MSTSNSIVNHLSGDPSEACHLDFWYLEGSKAVQANSLSNLALFIEIDKENPVVAAIGHWLIVCLFKRGINVHPRPRHRNPRSVAEGRERWFHCTPRTSVKPANAAYGTYTIPYQLLIEIIHRGELQYTVLKKAHHPVPVQGLPLYPMDFYRLCQAFPAVQAANRKVVMKWGAKFALELPAAETTMSKALSTGLSTSDWILGHLSSGLTGLSRWMTTGVGAHLLSSTEITTITAAGEVANRPKVASVIPVKEQETVVPPTAIPPHKVEAVVQKVAKPESGLMAFRVDTYVPRVPKNYNQYYVRLLCPSCNGCGTIVKRLRDPTDSGEVSLGKRKRPNSAVEEL